MAPFFGKIPSPADVAPTTPRSKQMQPGDLRQFRVAKLNPLRELKSKVFSETNAWYSESSDVLTKTIRVFDIALATYLASGFEIRSSERSARMVFGFPITGFSTHVE